MLAEKYLQALVTSAPSEKVFSVAGWKHLQLQARKFIA
jgi:hypothetical protein